MVLKNNVKFFDLKKIKGYVELRETQKDKLLELTKETIEKGFEIKSKNSIKEIEVPQKEFSSNFF